MEAVRHALERLHLSGARVIDFANQAQNLFDYLTRQGAVYVASMKTRMKCFKRSCWCLFVVEGLCAALSIVASNNSVVAYNLFPFIMLSVLVNIPGWGLAHGLGLLGPNGSLDPHPIAGAVVACVVGTLCWVALLWSICGCFDKDVPI
jgi:hypothetical protein